MTDPIITLTTDFGWSDPYVASMKGVLLRRCQDARIVDLSHDIAPQDLVAAALFAEAAIPWFPEDTIHALVVDPGVGTARRAVAVRAGGRLFVFPDNGVLTLLFRKLDVQEAFAIQHCPFLPDEVSRTFHGRDLFAPVAAWLALGHPLESLGPPAGLLVELDLPEHMTDDTGAVLGEVIHIDRFGNCVTNLPGALFDDPAVSHTIAIPGREKPLPLRGTYADVKRGDALALAGSTARIEIAVRNGSAAAELGLRVGDRVRAV